MHQEILESMNTALALLDMQRVFRYMNPAAAALLGVSPKRIIGTPLSALIPSVDQQLLAHQGQQALTLHDVAMQRADQKLVNLTCSLSPIESPTPGWVLEMMPHGRHERISQEAALWSQYEASSLLARTLAHEIKNPLAGISGSAQLLARQLTSPRQLAFVEVIIRETTRLNGLLDQMLGGQQTANWVQHNIHAVLEHVLQVVRGQMPEAIGLVKDYDPSLPELTMDFDRLVQVFLNLVRNAIQAMPDGGQLTIRTRIAHKMTLGNQLHPLVIVVEITDTGVGIPPELIDAIFLPMITNKSEGTGLGLPIAQTIVHQHDGLILVESKPQHTVFKVFLPIDNRHALQETEDV
ncbi:MAG: PAS domain-containing protein [Thiotrichales bacterium]|jgi:two-component system nitrogen regulation sensor histidine kinase GlnL|nr:PAS domain-containing protein [Thiotrichales bacterium]